MLDAREEQRERLRALEETVANVRGVAASRGPSCRLKWKRRLEAALTPMRAYEERWARLRTEDRKRSTPDESEGLETLRSEVLQASGAG